MRARLASIAHRREFPAASQQLSVFKRRYIPRHNARLLVIFSMPLQTIVVELAGELKFEGHNFFVRHREQ
jgi:hypothetical protein